MKVSCALDTLHSRLLPLVSINGSTNVTLNIRKNDKAFLYDCNNAKACLLRYKAENKAMLGSLSASH